MAFLAYVLLSLLLVAAMMILSHLIGERTTRRTTEQPFESGVAVLGDARLRFSARFYLVAMFFVIFDLEAVYLFAWAIALRDAGWPGFVEAMIFIAVLAAALIYLWRIGALDWGPHKEVR